MRKPVFDVVILTNEYEIKASFNGVRMRFPLSGAKYPN